MSIPPSRWKVQKANPDVERTHLNKILEAAAEAIGGNGAVDSISPGTGIDVDSTNPAIPEVSLDAATQASLGLADTSVQPSDLGTAAYENSGIFATASQGNLADTALQPGDPITALSNNAGYTSNVGTVTAVGLTSSTGLTASGGTILSSGNLRYDLSLTLLAWHGLATSAKEDTITAGTTAQFYRGDKAWASELLGSFTLTAYSNNSVPSQLRSQKARGTSSVPLKVINGDLLFSVQGRGYQETTGAFTGNVGSLDLEATQDFTSTTNGTRWAFSTTPNGSSTRADRLYLNDVSLNPATTSVLSLGTSALPWLNFFNAGARYDTGTESPAAWAANIDNLAIAAATRVLRISGTAARNLTGIVQTGAGRRLTLCNIGTFNIVIIHDLTSTAANRFLCPGSVNFTLTPNMAIELWYDNTSQRWRVIN